MNSVNVDIIWNNFLDKIKEQILLFHLKLGLKILNYIKSMEILQ